MEDEDDTVPSPSSLQQLQLKQSESELHQSATVSTTVISQEIPTPSVLDDVIQLALVRDGDVAAKNEGEFEAESVEGCEFSEVKIRGKLNNVEVFERGIGVEDVDKSVCVSEEEVVVAEIECGGDEGVNREENVENVETVDVSKEERGGQVIVDEGKVVEVASEVRGELSGDCVVVEAVESVNESGNVENVSDMEEKLVRGESVGQGEVVSEVQDELSGDDVVLEAVERVNESENVENVSDMEEKKVRVGSEDREEKVSEVWYVVVEATERVNESEHVENVNDMEEKQVRVESEDQGEMVSEVQNELNGDAVMVEAVGGEIWSEIVENVGDIGEEQLKGEVLAGVSEDIEVGNEVVGEKDEQISVEVRETSINANEVEGNEVMKDVGEGQSVVNGDEMSQVNEEVATVCEKVEAVSTDELGEKKAVNDEKGKEVEVPKEGGGDEMDQSPVVTKKNELAVNEVTPITDTEMKPEVETMISVGVSGGKRKRGQNSKATTPVKGPSRKVVTLVGEDVCFICLDGGDLVLCDRRGCPKTYHPSCVDHDDELIKFKGRWTCGWHLCNKCRKNAYSMCYTCQFSLCKACSKDAAFFCVRGNKGFCELCMKTIMMIENSEQNETGEDAFSDKSNWEYLFKDYWVEQKEKLCITPDELSQAKNRFKDSDRQQTSIEIHEGNNDAGGDSDSSLPNLELNNSKRKKTKSKSDSVDHITDSPAAKNASSGKGNSKRRLKAHTKTVNSDSDHSSPDTNSKRGKKARRLSKSRSMGVNDGAADESAGGNTEWASKELLEFVMHMKNGDQSVLTKFDVQDLLLEYIKRNKLRDPRRKSQIICDSMLQKLFGKPRIAHFEMLKLLEIHLFLKDSGGNQGSGTDTEMRELDSDNDTDLLQDGKKRKGKKSRKREQKASQSNLDDYAAIDRHNINLIFLHRNFMETLMENPETFHDKAVGSFVRVRISGSSQKQEMYRLVQITGTSKAAKPYKVGKRTTDVMLVILNLDKTETISIDTISNQEFFEDECKRLRQSIKCGVIHRMTVGDIVEKARALHEVRVVNWLEAETARLTHLRDRASENGRQKELRECVEKLQLLKTPEERHRRLNEIPEIHADPEMDPSFESEDESGSSSQASEGRPRESRKDMDYFKPRKGGSASSDSWSANARPPNQKLEPNRISFGMLFSDEKRDLVEHTSINEVDKGTAKSNIEEKPRTTSESSIHAEHSVVRSDISAVAVSESPRKSSVAGKTDSEVSETEKILHYRDPTGKVQGPFSVMQLRKWSNAGYFPPELRVWKISQSETDSMLLTDILVRKLDKGVPSVGRNLNVDSAIKNVPSSVDTSKLSENARSTFSSLPTPTVAQTSFQSSNQVRGGIEKLPSPTLRSAGQHSVSSSVLRPDLSSSSDITNSQHKGSQSTVQIETKPFIAPDSTINQENMARVSSNIIQPGTGQNPPVYTHGWSTANPSGTPNNPNPVHAQVPNCQWTAPVGNQAVSHNGGYAGPGNITTTNVTGTPVQNAWRPAPTNMPWGGQQQQTMTPNMIWAGPPGNTPGRGGDQSRSSGGDQRSRQSSFGSGRQRICKYHENGHCKKGASCNYMHA